MTALYASLRQQRYQDRNQRPRRIGIENILVVAPYNRRVNRLERVLPEGARIGTVDKFQGQEAEVVMVSFATSDGDTLPRSMDFLYNKRPAQCGPLPRPLAGAAGGLAGLAEGKIQYAGADGFGEFIVLG